MQPPFHVLIGEDDPHIVDILDYALRAQGYGVRQKLEGRAYVEETVANLSHELKGCLRAAAGAGFARIAAAAQFAYMVLFGYSFFFEGLTGLTITIGAIVTLALLMTMTARVNWANRFAAGPAARGA